jgi:hypothetical protein
MPNLANSELMPKLNPNLKNSELMPKRNLKHIKNCRLEQLQNVMFEKHG